MVTLPRGATIPTIGEQSATEVSANDYYVTTAEEKGECVKSDGVRNECVKSDGVCSECVKRLAYWNSRCIGHYSMLSL